MRGVLSATVRTSSVPLRSLPVAHARASVARSTTPRIACQTYLLPTFLTNRSTNTRVTSLHNATAQRYLDRLLELAELHNWPRLRPTAYLPAYALLPFYFHVEPLDSPPNGGCTSCQKTPVQDVVNMRACLSPFSPCCYVPVVSIPVGGWAGCQCVHKKPVQDAGNTHTLSCSCRIPYA